MTTDSTLHVTIAFADPDLDNEDRDREAMTLLTALKKDLDDLESVDRVPDLNPPEGNKTIGGFLVGLLAAEVSKENLKKLFGFLGSRLSGKSIKLKVKAPDGRELELEASSQQEFEFAYQKAQEFLKSS